MKYLFILAAGFAVMVSTVVAQQEDPISNPRGMVDNFNIGNVKSFLDEIGAASEIGSVDGQPYITASYEGLNFNLIPTACENNGAGNCLGLIIYATFFGVPVNQQTLSAFNQRYWFVTVGAAPDQNGAYISRYAVADYGIPRGNLASSLGSFFFLADQFKNELATSAQTVSQDGFADDMSARLLNGRSLSDVTGDQPVAASRLELHQAAFEQIPELVKKLTSGENLQNNKIENIKPE